MSPIIKPATRREMQDALRNEALKSRLPAKMLERFDAKRLATLLEREVRLCEHVDLSHVSLNMTLDDAMALVRHLRGQT